MQNYILNSRAFSCFLAEPGDVLLLHSSAASRKLLKLNSFLNSSTYSVMLYFRRLFLSSFPSARPAALEEEAWTEGVCRLEENLNRKQATLHQFKNLFSNSSIESIFHRSRLELLGTQQRQLQLSALGKCLKRDNRYLFCVDSPLCRDQLHGKIQCRRPRCRHHRRILELRFTLLEQLRNGPPCSLSAYH